MCVKYAFAHWNHTSHSCWWNIKLNIACNSSIIYLTKTNCIVDINWRSLHKLSAGAQILNFRFLSLFFAVFISKWTYSLEGIMNLMWFIWLFHFLYTRWHHRWKLRSEHLYIDLPLNLDIIFWNRDRKTRIDSFHQSKILFMLDSTVWFFVHILVTI